MAISPQWISSISSMAGSMLGTASQVSDIKSQSQAIVGQIEREADAYVFETSIINDQRKEARRELGDIMSDVGLEAVEAEATKRAMNAERGVSGGSVRASSLDVAVKANKANADAIRQYRNTDVTLLRRQLAKRVEFDNKTSSLASGIQSGSSAMLQALTGGVQGFSGGMQFGNALNEAGREYGWFNQ